MKITVIGSGYVGLVSGACLAEFTGTSSLYEAPENPELTVNTGEAELDTCTQQVIGEMTRRGITRQA